MSRLLRIQDHAPEFAQPNSEILGNKLHCVVDSRTHLSWLYSSAGEKVCYLAGRQSIESVLQLQARNPSATSPRTGVQTKLIFVTGLRDFSDPNFDVRSLQANPRNCGATFQVGSNFNGLEFIDSRNSRTDGIMKYEKAGFGPGLYASESCGAATLYRNYFVDSSDYSLESQTYSYNEYDDECMYEINMLDDPHIPDLLSVQHGFVPLRKAPTQADLQILESDAYKYVKIVRQDFAQVTYGLRRTLQSTGEEVLDVCEDHSQIVNRIFNGGIDWVDMRAHVRDEEIRKKFALFLLKAGMISSLLAARENCDALAAVPSCQGRNRFFPDLMGCGFFGNNLEWLMDAWRSPEVYPYIRHCGLEIVVCFQDVQSAEALAFAIQARGGSVPGFLGQAIEVEIVDAADCQAIARVFGPLHRQIEATLPVPTAIVEPVPRPVLEARQPQQAEERAEQETAQRLARGRLAAQRLRLLQNFYRGWSRDGVESDNVAQDLITRLGTQQEELAALSQAISRLRDSLTRPSLSRQEIDCFKADLVERQDQEKSAFLEIAMIKDRMWFLSTCQERSMDRAHIFPAVFALATVAEPPTAEMAGECFDAAQQLHEASAYKLTPMFEANVNGLFGQCFAARQQLCLCAARLESLDNRLRNADAEVVLRRANEREPPRIDELEAERCRREAELRAQKSFCNGICCGLFSKQ